uniref:Uncharacterized protein n=1 Tax=viral metagenome TaxID=1070528 RepID=A0A6C0EXM3_9ZZZZ
MTKKNKKHSKQHSGQHTKPKTKKHILRPHIIDKYCGIYKTDITGKETKELYKSCRKVKYCRKYKCKNIDSKFTKRKLKKLGPEFDSLIIRSLNIACPEPIIEDETEDDLSKVSSKTSSKGVSSKSSSKASSKSSNHEDMDRLQCEKRELKKIYKEHDMDILHNKVLQCDNITCNKEQKKFYNNIFNQKELKLKKNQKQLLSRKNLEDIVDMEAIERGD